MQGKTPICRKQPEVNRVGHLDCSHTCAQELNTAPSCTRCRCNIRSSNPRTHRTLRRYSCSRFLDIPSPRSCNTACHTGNFAPNPYNACTSWCRCHSSPFCALVLEAALFIILAGIALVPARFALILHIVARRAVALSITVETFAANCRVGLVGIAKVVLFAADSCVKWNLQDKAQKTS